jgi:IclR family transcriptional regulator, KDG regulon repressor
MVPPNNLVQTIERISAILDLVGQSSQGMGVRELSSRLRLPKGTVHRLLSSLSYIGYIRQDTASRNYFLGLKLLDLASLATSQLDLRKIAEPLLHNLAENSGETVHMVVWDKDEAVYIEKVESPLGTGGLRMASRVGSRNPAHSTAGGKVLLSYLPDDQLDRFIAEKGLPARTPNTITDRTALEHELNSIRVRGYAIDDEENEEGIRCIGAPIFGESGMPVAAISISGPAFRVTRKNSRDVFKEKIMGAAAEISRSLGYSERENKERANETK